MYYLNWSDDGSSDQILCFLIGSGREQVATMSHPSDFEPIHKTRLPRAVSRIKNIFQILVQSFKITLSSNLIKIPNKFIKIAFIFIIFLIHFLVFLSFYIQKRKFFAYFVVNICYGNKTINLILWTWTKI